MVEPVVGRGCAQDGVGEPFGAEVGDDLEQLGSQRGVVAGTNEGGVPHGRHDHVLVVPPADGGGVVRQQLGAAAVEQLQVLGDGGAVGQVGTGLDQRQRQRPQLADERHGVLGSKVSAGCRVEDSERIIVVQRCESHLLD